MRTLIVVDMQNDFIDGALGSLEAVKIVPAVKKRIEEYLERGDEVIFTRDTHGEDYLNTHEGKLLPVPHCVKDTFGWQIKDGLYRVGCEIVDKPSFGYLDWGGRNFEKVEIIGLCTDICVLSNAIILRALYPDADISVRADLCAGTSVDAHEAALKGMASCQIEILRD